MMFTSTDLSNLRQIMTESPEYEAILTRLLDSYNESICSITHEIRNPLTLVYSTLQLIEASHPEVCSFSHWPSLHENIVYMVQLLADLSDYNHGFSLHKKELDTGEFLKKFVLTYAASAGSSASFASRIAPDLPSIQADATKLREVLLNLLKNASEAISGRTDGSFRLEADTVSSPEQSSPMIRIRIRDNGCGIPAGHLEDIFQPFVSYKSGGTGLGLPLSRRIIEAHSGYLLADSAPGKGATFTVLLPASCPCGTE